ncbi:SYNTAXIN [Salix purpurea]|uniref:SYNTAXIN n=1 Tax=Salix purpurea TaxID=77065 RepID=A0A9Q0T9S6_SALPP|nr:SYNTAXIN [Salix purpurea]
MCETQYFVFPEMLEFKMHKTRLHIGQLVKDTSARLKQASETDHHAGVSQSKKIADAKLAKDFQAVLKEFQKAQRLAAERETAYTPFVPQAVLPSSYTASELDVRSDKSPEQRALLVESRRQEVLLLDNEIVFNEAIIEEREQGIHEIQQQIGEVNEIFKDLAVLVHEQGAMIDDIGSHIENAQAATSQGKSQLVKAAKTQRSNSSLACLLLVIFGIVILIVIVVLAAYQRWYMLCDVCRGSFWVALSGRLAYNLNSTIFLIISASSLDCFFFAIGSSMHANAAAKCQRMVLGENSLVSFAVLGEGRSSGKRWKRRKPGVLSSELSQQ